MAEVSGKTQSEALRQNCLCSVDLVPGVTEAKIGKILFFKKSSIIFLNMSHALPEVCEVSLDVQVQDGCWSGGAQRRAILAQ